MEDIGFFFNYENLVVQLPFNPPKVEVSYASNNKSSEIVKLGEITILRNRKLASISFSSFLPEGMWFPGIRTTGRFEQPQYYKDFFTDLMESGKPSRLIITGINLNMLVSVEKFDYFHQAGDHEDAYFNMSLKEYRPYAIQSVQVGSDLTASGRPVTEYTARQARTTNESGKITVGSIVLLTGYAYAENNEPGKADFHSNREVRVTLIERGATHPYHVADINGNWLGWADEGSVVMK